VITVSGNPRQNQKSSLAKRYNPKLVEAKWQKYWLTEDIYQEVYQFHKEDVERPVFVIDTPPPFTSGELHMGHAYWNILNDTLARYKRMRGYNVLLPQGWDCQGLPTELKVQDIWKISKTDPEFFREKCMEWTERMITSMKSTMIRLGYRPDWEQFEYRTMDPTYWQIVQLTLLDFFEKGLIYREAFPVHWCPHCETALAQAELGYIEQTGFLYYVHFISSQSNIEVATTRPELIPACQAVAVHPDDARYSGLIGTSVKTPLFETEVPVLADRDVDSDFGSGVVMICTFGDEQDIRWQQKYTLPISKQIDEKGRLINTQKYDGMTLAEAREAITQDLSNAGYLVRQDAITHKVLCHTERADCLYPIEFLVKDQFFIKTMAFKERVIKASDEMTWEPEYMRQRLIDWVESIEWDWLISRQRLYGTPIPFWYCEECNTIYPAHSEQLPVNPVKAQPPISSCSQCGSTKIVACNDVCDCWVDSSITPLVISGYFSNEAYFSRAYPANFRQQGHDIIRTWFYYTTYRCLGLTQQKPFHEVLINGHVLGPEGYRMSKSRGNVISPEDKLEDLGADSLRQSLLSVTLGSDFSFNWELVKYCRGFLQKYWSSIRFASRFLGEYSPATSDAENLATMDKWILHKLRETLTKINSHLDSYQTHSAIQIIQNFVWHHFCDQYLEAVKYRLYDRRSEKDYAAVQYTLYTVLWNTTLMLAPICPHITEEIYQTLLYHESTHSIHGLPWPIEEAIPINHHSHAAGEHLVEALSKIRRVKAQAKIPLSQQIDTVTIKAPTEILETLKRQHQDLTNILHIQTIKFQEADDLVVEIVSP
jgi:valyl-tRNA synthetase